MCKIQYGKNIRTELDVENMVVGIILRQQNLFKEEDIVESTKKFIKDATVNMTPLALNSLIAKKIDVLVRYKKIKCLDGIYTPLQVEEY